MRPKLVRASCDEAIGESPKAEQGWSDTYLQFAGKPKGKTQYWGPTFCSRSDVERSRELALYMADLYAGMIADNGGEPVTRLMFGRIKQTIDAPLVEMEREEARECDLLLEKLSREDIVIEECGENMPNIYTNRAKLNRAEIERMIGALMVTLGHPCIRVKWVRPKRAGRSIIPY